MKEMKINDNITVGFYNNAGLWINVTDGVLKVHATCTKKEYSALAHFIQSHAPDQELTPEVLEGIKLSEMDSLKIWEYSIAEEYYHKNLCIRVEDDIAKILNRHNGKLIREAHTLPELLEQIILLTGQHLKA